MLFQHSGILSTLFYQRLCLLNTLVNQGYRIFYRVNFMMNKLGNRGYLIVFLTTASSMALTAGPLIVNYMRSTPSIRGRSCCRGTHARHERSHDYHTICPCRTETFGRTRRTGTMKAGVDTVQANKTDHSASRRLTSHAHVSAESCLSISKGAGKQYKSKWMKLSVKPS